MKATAWEQLDAFCRLFLLRAGLSNKHYVTSCEVCESVRVQASSFAACFQLHTVKQTPGNPA